jgi:hypothetical protein
MKRQVRIRGRVVIVSRSRLMWPFVHLIHLALDGQGRAGGCKAGTRTPCPRSSRDSCTRLPLAIKQCLPHGRSHIRKAQKCIFGRHGAEPCDSRRSSFLELTLAPEDLRFICRFLKAQIATQSATNVGSRFPTPKIGNAEDPNTSSVEEDVKETKKTIGAAFQDRCLQPLGHPSNARIPAARPDVARLVPIRSSPDSTALDAASMTGAGSSHLLSFDGIEVTPRASRQIALSSGSGGARLCRQQELEFRRRRPALLDETAGQHAIT